MVVRDDTNISFMQNNLGSTRCVNHSQLSSFSVVDKAKAKGNTTGYWHHEILQPCAFELAYQKGSIGGDNRPSISNARMHGAKRPKCTTKYSDICTIVSPNLRSKGLHHSIRAQFTRLIAPNSLASWLYASSQSPYTILNAVCLSFHVVPSIIL
jgi:hypothetical protein